MTAPNLTPRIQETFDKGLEYLKRHFGRNGLKQNQEIDPEIHWTPSYHVKVGGALIVAAEVSDELYPRIVKEALADIRQYDRPISIYVVCPLEVYTADVKQTIVSQLVKQGIGVITINDSGKAMLQHPCTPVVQNISEDELEGLIKPLTSKLKNKFRSVRETYQTNTGQGLQEAGQVVEAILKSVAESAGSRGWVSSGIQGNQAAAIIDELWDSPQFTAHRAALGGARNFVKGYRNIASHPEKTSRELLDKINKCRKGILDAVRTANELLDVARALGFRIKIV